MSATRTDLEGALRQTLEDGRLSRSERRALGELLAEQPRDPLELAVLRARVFELARERLRHPEDREVLAWVEEVVKTFLVAAPAPARPAGRAEAWFSPGGDCHERIVALFEGARRRVDACVFTITDDRVARAMLGAHRRGVALRVITDDDKCWDRGSDIEKLVDAGVPVRFDPDPAHMHHKFAIFDGELLLTGSYNWTRGAAEHNWENLIALDDDRLVTPFSRVFEQLWEAFAEAP